MLANMLYIVLERWLMVPAKCTSKSKNRLFGKGDRTSTAAQAQGTRLQSKLSPLSMCIRPYPSHITQCKPIVTSHSLRALGKRKSLQEKTNILSLFLFVHMFPTKKKKQFLCFPSPRAFTTKYKTCLCVCSACSVIQHTCVRPVFGVPKVSGQMKNQTQWQFCDLCWCFNGTPLLCSTKHRSLFKSKETIWLLHGIGDAVCGQPSSKASDRQAMMQQSSKHCISMHPGEKHIS